MTPWERATLALTLLAIDPQNLGGMIVHARVGPARRAFEAAASALPIPSVRLHPHMTAQVLDGEIDLSATLSGGTLVQQRGLLDRPPSLIVLPMAERVDPYMSARLGQALDSGRSHALLAFDETAENGEALPEALTDRTAFRVALDTIALGDLAPITIPDGLAMLRRRARKVSVSKQMLEDLVILAVSLGISSLRAPSFALCAAQTHAILKGRNELTSEDVSATVALVYAHRATRLPQVPENDISPPDSSGEAPEQTEDVSVPNDVMLDAVKASLPPDVLAQLSTTPTRGASGSGSGTKRIGNRKGRPLPARQGARTNIARIDLIATLRAAIPWQTLRKRRHPTRKGPIFRQSDLRQKRYETLSDRLLIFAVDASGSAAMSRLAEAKGAVELLLGQAYARRDHVALVSYRGTDAEVLLAPTRSLVQTKRRLAAIPGGGATPLATGLSRAVEIAHTATQKGLTPTVVLLADGRANIALNGDADRAKANMDAQTLAAKIAAAGIEALVIDTTTRPEKTLQNLAQTMNATYILLPRADARRVSSAISKSLAE
ncbi:MAG: magnesium chelatase subunit D [Paracoccaceae bacterium]